VAMKKIEMGKVDIAEKNPHLVNAEDKHQQSEKIDTVQSVAAESSDTVQKKVDAKERPLQKRNSLLNQLDIPLVLSVVDILAVVFFFMAMIISTTLDAGGAYIHFNDSLLLQTIVNGTYMLIALILQSCWFGEIMARVHKSRNEKGTIRIIDRIACINPILLALVPLVLYGLCFAHVGYLAFYGLISLVLLSFVSLIVMSVRWLQSACGLSFYSAALGEDLPPQSRKAASTLGGLATIALMGLLPFLFVVQHGAYTIPLATLVTGICFVALRNRLIQNDPFNQLDSEVLLAKSQALESGAVQIRYNHFVEIQKWFKQRLSLHSRWKLALALLILLGAILVYIFDPGLNCLINAVTFLAGGKISVDEAGNPSGMVREAFIQNRLLNFILVNMFGLLAATISGSALVAFLRAPKKLTADSVGLQVGFSPLSMKDNQSVPWESIKHIKVMRPKGKMTAASDLLIFEKYIGEPISLKLAGISSADDREKLLGAIDRFAPQISREAAIEETLRRPIEQNYTELWLQALAAPPKREKLKPLIEDATLSDNRYLVKRQLGAGGQGFAYLAIDQRRDKEVVLKEFVLPVFVDINARRQSLESFEKEAKLLSKLDNPQIVKLEGFFVEDHRAYLVLEHIDGRNLRQIVQAEGPLSEERINSLAKQMCSILTYLHSLSPPLVHRDFTPDNLILNKDGTLKLIDFNVAQQVEYATTGTVVGKQAYLPPEQFRGQAVPASDLYAFGATLYFLAAGKDPTPISVARPIKDGIDLSTALDHLISSLTQMEASARPADAKEVAELLE